MKPYIPIYHRLPNRFSHYEERKFDDGAGHTGTERIAIYFNKKGKRCEEVVQVIWNK